MSYYSSCASCDVLQIAGRCLDFICASQPSLLPTFHSLLRPREGAVVTDPTQQGAAPFFARYAFAGRREGREEPEVPKPREPRDPSPPPPLSAAFRLGSHPRRRRGSCRSRVRRGGGAA